MKEIPFNLFCNRVTPFPKDCDPLGVKVKPVQEGGNRMGAFVGIFDGLREGSGKGFFDGGLKTNQNHYK